MKNTITTESANQRLDRYLRKLCKSYPDVTLSMIYQWIRKGSILVNGKRTKEDYRVREGDQIELKDTGLDGKSPVQRISPKEKKMKQIPITEITKHIIFEDENWIVRNKPAGIVLHPSNKHRNDLCMNDYLEIYCKHIKLQPEKKENMQTFQPAFGYRLDKDTSGVLIAGKTYKALQYINQIIRDRQTTKRYYARVVGNFPKHRIFDKPLERGYDAKFDRAHVVVNTKQGSDSLTECRAEKVIYHPILGQISLVRIRLYTGRMHQIRVHLQDG